MLRWSYLQMIYTLIGISLCVGCATDRTSSTTVGFRRNATPLDARTLTLEVPEGFVLVRTEAIASSNSMPALVEPAYLEDAPRDAIPTGEFPAIMFQMNTPDHLEVSARILEETDIDGWRIQLDGREVYRLPRAPGLFGDQAHYYIVPLTDGTLLVIMAHRFHWDEAGEPPTHYDQVIENLIPTLTVQNSSPN